MSTSWIARGLCAFSIAASAVTASVLEARKASDKAITPKVFIIDLFPPEGAAWYGIKEFNLLEKNITVPGLSPLFPQVHCTKDEQICQVVTGESEINAASTIMALTLSPLFNFKTTYFLIAGIAGASPKVTTLGSVTFARYAIQVGLQYEFDAREKPENFTTGYFPQGSNSPNEYPGDIYGTEVFEVNEPLRRLAMGFARTAKLADSDEAKLYRSKYATTATYKAGSEPPSVVGCDVATADVYFSGALLGDAFENTTKLFTNGSGIYCTTAQEDNAVLEVMVRAASSKLVDYSRIIVMRTVSDFDRPYAGESPFFNLRLATTGGFEISLSNIYLAGIKVVEGILTHWSTTFKKGVKPTNYVGDIFGTLGGKPDFGPGSTFGDNPVGMRKRGVGSMNRRRMMPVRLAGLPHMQG